MQYPDIAQILRITIAVKLAWVQDETERWTPYPLKQAFHLLQQEPFVLEYTKGPASTFKRHCPAEYVEDFFDALSNAHDQVRINGENL